MMHDDIVPIPLLSAELLRAVGLAGPGYRRLVELASSAMLPCEQINGRWYCARKKIPEVARVLTELGLMRLAPARLRAVS